MTRPLYVSLWVLLACLTGSGCQGQNHPASRAVTHKTMSTSLENLPRTPMTPPEGRQLATFGSGCFWCTEAFFQETEGVTRVVSGYSGGHVDNPTYRQVSQGTTGHAEVIHIEYDPARVSFEKLLEVFWMTHDPTTRDRQGNDVGPQYRSAVFFHSPEQERLATQIRQRLDESGAFKAPIVTEITAFTNFYAAEDYHQNYYRDNPGQPYCQFVIRPKMDKFRKAFGKAEGATPPR